MKGTDFILIQVDEKDEFYELAKIKPYFKDCEPDLDRGYYCKGLAQNNTHIYEFILHLGKTETQIKQKFQKISYPVDKHNGQKVKVQ